MQTDFRLILLSVGILLIVAIVFDGFRKKKEHKQRNEMHQEAAKKPHECLDNRDAAQPKEADGHNLALDLTQEEATPPFEVKDASSGEPSDTPIPVSLKKMPESILSLTILANMGKGFTGRFLASTLRTAQFQLGQHKLFHQYLNNDPSQGILCSLASLIEPGVFENDTYIDQTYPGLILFMVIPGLPDPIQGFENMLVTGRKLAVALHGNLCDDQRQYLTVRTIENYRDKIREFLGLPLSNPRVVKV